jgi:hypothetical protein
MVVRLFNFTMAYTNDLDLPTVPPDLSPGYRRELVPYIFNAIRGGWSCAVVGSAGTGLSNLLRFISEPRTIANYLSATSSLTLPVYVDLPIDTRDLYGGIIQQMIRSARVFNWPKAEQAALHYAERKLDQAAPAELENLLADAIKQCGAEPKRRILIILDGFDAAFLALPVATLRRLRQLRDGNKQSLVYLVGTRREMARLDVQRSASAGKFIELFGQHTYPLRPYTAQDAHVLMARKTFDWYSRPTADDEARLYRLTGGHAKLLVAALLSWKQRRSLPWFNVEQALQHDLQIVELCRAIWNDLEPIEQLALIALATDRRSVAQAEALDLLRLKGLVVGHPAMIFATLFEFFVRQQPQLPVLTATPWEPATLREPDPDIRW